jgi:hypothetical protein
MSCPICASAVTAPHDVFRVERTPVQEGYLWPDATSARACDLGSITLAFCSDCGHVWNRSFEPARLRFDPEYDISLFHSPAYRSYVEGAMQRLVERYALRGKVGLEIACGKGDFLRVMIAAGLSRAIGFDPTFIESNLSAQDRTQIEAHRDYYDERHAGVHADLVACRSALQYFTAPMPFLKMLRRTLGTRTNVPLYFEVPNGVETFRDRTIWNVVYEHGCFYNPASLSKAFRLAGFDVRFLAPGLNGSQLEIEATPSTGEIGSGETFDDLRQQMTKWVADFASEFARKSAAWDGRLRAAQTSGRRVAIWGAGARAIGFLVAVPSAAGTVGVAVDINPRRQSRHLPFGGQRVLSPDELVAWKPDLIIASNPNFAREIETQVRGLGLTSDFVALD